VNDYQIGKTKVKDDTLNPRWEKAQFNVQVPLRRNKEPSDEHPDRKVRGEKKLKVEITVWDWDLIGDNDFLGRVVLTERHLLRKDGIQEIELGPDPGKPETMLQFKGSIRVRCTVFGSVVLQVLEAEGVAQMDTFGASDPYVERTLLLLLLPLLLHYYTATLLAVLRPLSYYCWCYACPATTPLPHPLRPPPSPPPPTAPPLSQVLYFAVAGLERAQGGQDQTPQQHQAAHLERGVVA